MAANPEGNLLQRFRPQVLDYNNVDKSINKCLLHIVCWLHNLTGARVHDPSVLYFCTMVWEFLIVQVENGRIVDECPAKFKTFQWALMNCRVLKAREGGREGLDEHNKYIILARQKAVTFIIIKIGITISLPEKTPSRNPNHLGGGDML